MVRCYDCGQPIPDHEIVRRMVRTGVSVGKNSPRYHFHKVNLCPGCATSRTIWSIVLFFLGLGVAGAVVLGCGIGVAFMPKTAGPTQQVPSSDEAQKAARNPEQKPDTVSIPATGVIRISAEDLLAHYQADEKAADRHFRDRTVEVTGKVICVWMTKLDKPVVVFGQGCGISANKVEFYFEATDNKNVQEGATCVIQGRCMGKGISGPWFKECVVVSATQ